MNTDSEIVRRSRQEAAAFGELFERHARAVVGFASRRVGADVAEDVLSETFLVAFRRRASFDLRVDSARPWLLGIATRIIHRHRASEAKQLRSLLAQPPERARPDDSDGLSDRLDASASLRELAPRVAALAKKDRDTLFLFAWGDLSYEETAQALGVPVGTVKSRLNRVRRLLASARAGNKTSTSTQHTSEVEYGHLG
ncbi:MAG: RNA polymerase sigma factor [Microbacterium sp.]